MRKFLSLLLALLMLPLPGALAAEKYETLPEHMQMTQSFEHERWATTYPSTAPGRSRQTSPSTPSCAPPSISWKPRAAPICLPAPPAIRRARCWTWAPRCTARAKAGPPS